MSDIVELLRAENADPRNWRRMYGEAADEIERLRGDMHKTVKLLIAEARTLARLIETKATVTWREQDAAHLRNAADAEGADMSDIVERLSLSSDPEKRDAAVEIERLRAALGQCSKVAQSAVAAERAAILELAESFARSWDQDDATSWHEAAQSIAAAIKARTDAG